MGINLEAVTRLGMSMGINLEFIKYKELKTSREHRIKVSDELVEGYFKYNEVIPSSDLLDRLATLILQDEIADPTPYKSRNNEYPIQSPRQEADYCKKLTAKGVPESLGTDFVDYRLPTRRQRTPSENAHIDREMGAKKRNSYR